MILEEEVKDKLYSSINESLGIADLVDRETVKIIGELDKEIHSGKHEAEFKKEGIKFQEFSFSTTVFDEKAVVAVYHYNFFTQEVFDREVNNYDVYDGSIFKIGKTFHITIKCYSISGTLQKHDAAETLQHELGHAYECFEGSTFLEKDIPKYTVAKTYFRSINEPERNLAQCVYLSFRFEQDGYINGLYGYLKQKNKIIPAWNDIKTSDFYHILVMFENALAYLKENENSEELKNLCKSHYKKRLKDIISVAEESVKRMYKGASKVLIRLRQDTINEGNGYWRMYFPVSGKSNYKYSPKFWEEGDGIERIL